MSEARNVIVLILVLLFIFVGVSVAISRISKKSATAEGKKDGIGFIQRIFLGSEEEKPTVAANTVKNDTTTAAQASAPAAQANTNTKQDSKDVTYTFAPSNNGSATTTTSTASITPAVVPSMQKGETPSEIPSTGANPFVLILSLVGLTSGIYLHKKA